MNSGFLNDNFLLVNDNKNLPVLDHMKQCNYVWDQIVKSLFGFNSIELIDNFGKYLVLR